MPRGSIPYVDVRALGRGYRLARLGDDQIALAVDEKRLVDVVVEAFAEEQQRLAAALHVAEPPRYVLDGVERPARVERTLIVVGITNRLRTLKPFHRAAHRVAGIGIDFVGRFPQMNSQLLRRPMEASAPETIDCGLEELPTAGQLLARLLTTARKHHSGQIVGAECWSMKRLTSSRTLFVRVT